MANQNAPALSPNALRMAQKLLTLPRAWITAATLASAVGISRRTVLRELPDLERWMEAQGFRFLRSPGQGLMLDEDSASRSRLKQLLEENQLPGTLSRQERRQKLLLILFQSQEPQKIYVLARQLDISENTLSADLDAVEEKLQSWDVALRRRPGVGVWLEAPPETLRRALAKLLKTSQFSRELQALFRGEAAADSPLSCLLDPRDTHIIWETLQQFDQEEQLRFSDLHMVSLTLHLALTVQQLRQNTLPGEELSQDPISPLAKRLAEHLSQALELPIPPAEVRNIGLYLEAYGQSSGIDSREMSLTYLVNFLLRRISELLQRDLTADIALADGLRSHLRPMLIRLQNQVPIENPQLSLLREQYAELWDATMTVCVQAHQMGLCPKIPDSEVGYLAMHIGAVLEEEARRNMRLDVVIVCPYGAASSRFLAAQLQREFPDIQVAACRSIQALDPESLRQQGIDLVISTVPLQVKYPHIRINAILQDSDRAILRAVLDAARDRTAAPKAPKPDRRAALRYTAELSTQILSLLSHVAVQTLQAPRNKESVLHAAACLFCEDPNQRAQVEALLWRRENLGDTYIKPLQALLLHCRTDEVDSCCLGYLAMEPPLYLDGQRVQGALVLLAPAQGEVPLEVMQAVSTLLIEEPALMSALQRCDQGKAVELLESGLSKRFRQALTMRLL